jgi:hypothetical protein
MPGWFIVGEGSLSTHWKGGWVDPRSNVDIMEKRKNLFPLPGIEPKLLGSPTCSLVNNTD